MSTAIDLSTAGIKAGYAVETVAGTKPEAFTPIPGVKSIPALSAPPENLETTTLDVKSGGWRTYIQGLRDTGGAMELKFNDSNALHAAWKALYDAYVAAKTAGKKTWVVFWIPTMTDSFFFTADVTPLGFGGAEINAVLENSGFLTPNGNIDWDTAIEPTTGGGT